MAELDDRPAFGTPLFAPCARESAIPSNELFDDILFVGERISRGYLEIKSPLRAFTQAHADLVCGLLGVSFINSTPLVFRDMGREMADRLDTLEAVHPRCRFRPCNHFGRDNYQQIHGVLAAYFRAVMPLPSLFRFTALNRTKTPARDQHKDIRLRQFFCHLNGPMIRPLFRRIEKDLEGRLFTQVSSEPFSEGFIGQAMVVGWWAQMIRNEQLHDTTLRVTSLGLVVGRLRLPPHTPSCDAFGIRHEY